MAGQRIRDIFKHFEGKPVGEFASDARKYQRLVYGLSMRNDMSGAHFDMVKLASAYANTLTPEAIPILNMDDRARPQMDPIGIERSFEYLSEIENGFEIGGRRSVANAPNTVIKLTQNGIDVRPLLFTVLAKSLQHDQPTKLFLAEGFKYISATDYDEENQTIQFFTNPAKLEQLTQRFKNMIGADVNFMETTQGTASENSLKTVIMPIGSSGDKNRPGGPRKGTRFNMLLMWGLNEQTLVQADLFRGAMTGHSIPMNFDIDPRNLINSADVEAFNLFDGQVKIDKDGNLLVLNSNGEYVQHEKGTPLLEIGSDRKHIHAFTFWNGNRQQISTMSNPIYGHRGAKIRISGIEKVTQPNGTFRFMVKADMLVPVGGNMRALSQNLKMVFTGMGSFIDPETKKLRSVFTDVADHINAAIDKHKDEKISIYGMNIGSLGSVFKRTFQALGMSSESNKAHLDVNKVHGLVGESIIKSGVALLHTGYALLSGEHDGGAWAKHFLSLFENKNKAAQFDTMLSRLQKDVSDAIKIDKTNVSDLKQLFLLQGLDALLTGQGVLETSLREHLTNARSEKIKATINAIRSGNLNVVTELSDRVVLAAAAAYHAMSMVEIGKNLRQEMIGMSRTIGGRSLDTTVSDPNHQIPNIMWDTAIPIQFVENMSVAMPMSNRQSAIYHVNYVSQHSQALLKALRFNPEVENRSRIVAELLAIGYMGGSALSVATNAIKRLNVGKGHNQPNLNISSRENLMVAGVHFEPLSYTFAGMNESSERALLAMSDLVRDVTYGRVENGMQRDLTSDELASIKKEYMQHIETLKASMGTGNTVNMRTSPQLQEHQIQSFKLMSKARLAGPVMKIPVFAFRDYNEHTHELVNLTYEQISLPSPDAAVKLQTFDNHTGEILKLYHEVLSQNLAVRNVIKQAQMFGGMISSQVREQYENWYNKVQELQVKIREASTTDIQKTMAAMTGVQGFAMIANTISGFDNLVFGEKSKVVNSDGTSQQLRFENVIVVGDEVLMTIVSEAMVALKIGKEHGKNYLRAKHIDVAADGRPLSVDQLNQLKLTGQSAVPKNSRRARHTFQPNPLHFEDYLLNSADTYDGSPSLHRGVGAVLESISTSYNHYVEHTSAKINKLRKLAITMDSNINTYKAQNLRISQDRITYIKYFKNNNEQIQKETPVKDIFALKIQQEALKQQVSTIEKYSINEIAKHDIKLSYELITEKLEVLAYTHEHMEKLDSRIAEVKHLMNTKVISSSDIKSYKKQLRFLENQKNRINNGFVYTPKELMSGIDFKDIDHALGTIGINLQKMIGDENSRHSFMSDNSGKDYLKKIHGLLNTDQMINLITDHQNLIKSGIAMAATRAGGPVGPFGPVGYIVMGNREFSSHLRKLGSSINIDPYMNRRSMFLHLSGMALNLGDYDGDMSIVAQIKRYTYLKTLQTMLTDEGLGALERSAMATVDELKAKGASEEEIKATREIKLIGLDREGNRVGLLKELQGLEDHLYRRHGQLLIEQTERHLGLRKGYISEEYAPQEFGVQWQDAEARQDQAAKDLMMVRLATKLNTFASDMYSTIWDKGQDVIRNYLKATGKPEVDMDSMSMQELNDVLEKSNEFKEGIVGWYNKASQGMLAKTFGTIFGSEMTVDNVLKYGIKVAFASTKLIGNWTNVQTMQQSLNGYNRMSTYTELEKIKKVVVEAAEATGDQTHVENLVKQFDEIRSTQIKQADEIHERVSGYMGNLQQATRDAIKEKAITNIKSNQSVFESMLANNPLIRAIDKTYGLLYGKSIFEHQLPELSRQGDIFQTILDIGADQVIEIMHDAKGNVKAQLAQGIMENEQFAKVAEHTVLPHLEALAVQQNAINKIESKLIGMTDREKLQFLLSEDGLGEDGRTTALLAAHSFLQNAEHHEQLRAYNKAVFSNQVSHFEKARVQMDDHLKLVFLHEKLSGAKMDEVALDRVMSDIVATYVSPYSNIERLQEEAHAVDSTGHFAHTMTQLVSSYLSGQDVGSRFESLKRKDEQHYKLLAEMEYMLADVVPGANPLANVEHQKTLNQDIQFAKAIKQAKNIHGSVLSNSVHGGIMAVLPAFGKHAGIFLTAGAGVGVGLLGHTQSAQAAQMVHGQHEHSQEGSTFAKIMDYAAGVTLMWQPHMALKYMERMNMPFEEQVSAQIGFVGAMAAGHLAAVKAARMFGPRGAAIASMVGMMSSAGIINTVMGEVSRVRHELKQPEYVMATQIVDDINLANAIAAGVVAGMVTGSLSSLGEPEDRPAVMVDENGDPIPVSDEVTEEDINRGISDEDGNGIRARNISDSSVPDVYGKPEGIGTQKGIVTNQEKMQSAINSAKNYLHK